MCPVDMSLVQCAQSGKDEGGVGEIRWSTYHSLLSKEADLLDGTRSSLLEADAVNLYTKYMLDHMLFSQSSVRCSNAKALLKGQYALEPSVDFIKLNVPSCGGGWCIRGRRHPRWRNGHPWRRRASVAWSWSTFRRIEGGGDREVWMSLGVMEVVDVAKQPRKVRRGDICESA